MSEAAKQDLWSIHDPSGKHVWQCWSANCWQTEVKQGWNIFDSYDWESHSRHLQTWCRIWKGLIYIISCSAENGPRFHRLGKAIWGPLTPSRCTGCVPSRILGGSSCLCRIVRVASARRLGWHWSWWKWWMIIKTWVLTWNIGTSMFHHVLFYRLEILGPANWWLVTGTSWVSAGTEACVDSAPYLWRLGGTWNARHRRWSETGSHHSYCSICFLKFNYGHWYGTAEIRSRIAIICIHLPIFAHQFIHWIMKDLIVVPLYWCTSWTQPWKQLAMFDWQSHWNLYIDLRCFNDLWQNQIMFMLGEVTLGCCCQVLVLLVGRCDVVFSGHCDHRPHCFP